MTDRLKSKNQEIKKNLIRNRTTLIFSTETHVNIRLCSKYYIVKIVQIKKTR